MVIIEGMRMCGIYYFCCAFLFLLLTRALSRKNSAGCGGDFFVSPMHMPVVSPYLYMCLACERIKKWINFGKQSNAWYTKRCYFSESVINKHIQRATSCRNGAVLQNCSV